MAKFYIGDLVVLKSGSMRMCVEDATDDAIKTVWCHEGIIGRDTFNPALLNKWEHREDQPRGGRDDRGGPGKGGFGGGRDRDDRGGGRHGGDRDRDDRPPRKTGWDGKPREKKHFRHDD